MDDTTNSIDPHAGDDGPATTAVAGAPGGSGAASPEFKVTDDKNQVTYGDTKYVREEALHEARQQLQQYAATIKGMEPLLPEFREFLEQRRQGDRAQVQRNVPESDEQWSADELEGYAITRGYYDRNNRPDVARAKNDLDVMAAIADRRASRQVAPVVDTAIKTNSERQIERLLAQKLDDGDPIADAQYLRTVLDSVPDAQKADEGQANILAVFAAGLQALDQRRQGKGRSQREPVFRESGGDSRASDNVRSLDALDRAAAKARGRTPDQWSKLQNQVSGADRGGTVLEEI